MEIKGSVAVITGGGNGIGEAIAKYFVTHGAKVVIVDMAQKHIDRVLGEIKAMGGEAIGVQASVTSEADTARFYQAALEAFGKINIVVSCAGIIRDGTMLGIDKETGKVNRKMGLDKWQPVIDTNLTVEQCRIGQRTRRDNARHGALDRPLAGRRIADLLADHHRFAEPHQFGQILLDGVIRHTGHLDRPPGALPARGQRDVEQASRFFGILKEQLVKIAHAVEQQQIRVLCFQSQILLHHRRMPVEIDKRVGTFHEQSGLERRCTVCVDQL